MREGGGGHGDWGWVRWLVRLLDGLVRLWIPLGHSIPHFRLP